MKRLHLPLLALSLFATSLLYAQQATVIINNAPVTTISKNIYGHFAEHLGHCIYGGFYVGDTSKNIPNTDGVRKRRHCVRQGSQL